MIPVGKKSIAPLLTRSAHDATALEGPAPSTSHAHTSSSTQTQTQMEPAKAHAKVVGEPAVSSTQTARPASSALDARLAAGVEVRKDPIGAHTAQLKADLKVALSTLKTLPPALTFFGGARIQKTDPYYAISQQIGRLLAERAVPPRTGAGPGIMQSVPEGYVQHREALVAAGQAPVLAPQLRVIDGVGAEARLDDTRTQGFNIKLPHEQKLNPVIEVAKEIQLFPFRKLALYENARGVVTFPGGFGTLDELFEIWNLARTGKLSDPLAAVGVDFWGPSLRALEKVAVQERALITPTDFARLFVTDSPEALLDHMLAPSSSQGGRAKGFEQAPAQLEETLLREVDVAAAGMKSLRPAVAFLGGERLADNDPALGVVKELAAVLAHAGAAVRVGDAGSGSDAVVAAAHAAGAPADGVQQVLWQTSPTTTATTTTTTTTTTFQERIPHKELLLRTAEAYVVLPSGLQGLDEMATVLCQMQTGKLPRRPLVLVGSDYWQPILDAWQQTMVTPDRKLIAPEDMELFTVVDSVADARAALTNLR